MTDYLIYKDGMLYVRGLSAEEEGHIFHPTHGSVMDEKRFYWGYLNPTQEFIYSLPLLLGPDGIEHALWWFPNYLTTAMLIRSGVSVETVKVIQEL